MSVCCVSCFSNTALKRWVRRNGRTREAGELCEFCESPRGHVVEASELSAMFRRVVNRELMPVEDYSYQLGAPLDEVLDDNFNVFSERVTNFNRRADLLDEILDDHPEPKDESIFAADDWCTREEDVFGRSMHDYWDTLAREAQRMGHGIIGPRNRFQGQGESQEAYEVLLEQLRQMRRRIPAGEKFWRARIGAGHTGPHLAAPPAAKARSGRGNNQGQRVLYLADDLSTAVHEVRPSAADVVSAARFVTTRRLQVCDLSSVYERTTAFVDSDTEYARHLKRVARNELRSVLGGALGRPVRRDDEEREYIPTQLLCRIVADLGMHGILYDAAQANGIRSWRDETPAKRSLLLFAPDAAQQEGEATEVIVERVTYGFREAHAHERAELARQRAAGTASSLSA